MPGTNEIKYTEQLLGAYWALGVTAFDEGVLETLSLGAPSSEAGSSGSKTRTTRKFSV